jgi:chemotaxis protein CheD
MERELKMAEIIVTADPDDVVTAVGVGSCLLISLYDRRLRIGGLAHAVLPSPLAEDGRRDTRYVEPAIKMTMERMGALGARIASMEAKLVGGANMFPGLDDEVGAGNVSEARAALDRLGVPVVAEAVGGSIGRSVEFSVASGYVIVRTKL